MLHSDEIICIASEDELEKTLNIGEYQLKRFILYTNKARVIGIYILVQHSRSHQQLTDQNGYSWTLFN